MTDETLKKLKIKPMGQSYDSKKHETMLFGYTRTQVLRWVDILKQHQYDVTFGFEQGAYFACVKEGAK